MKKEIAWYSVAGVVSSIVLDVGRKHFSFIPQQAPEVMFWAAVGIFAVGALMLVIGEVKEFLDKIKG